MLSNVPNLNKTPNCLNEKSIIFNNLKDGQN